MILKETWCLQLCIITGRMCLKFNYIVRNELLTFQHHMWKLLRIFRHVNLFRCRGSSCYRSRSDCSYSLVPASAGGPPLLPPPFFSCPGQRNRRRLVPVPMTGMCYNSLLWMCMLNTLTWPDITWPDLTCAVVSEVIVCIGSPHSSWGSFIYLFIYSFIFLNFNFFYYIKLKSKTTNFHY